MKSIDGGASWSISQDTMTHGSGYRTPMTFAKLSSGKMLLTFAKYDGTELFYQVYNGTVWGNIQSTSGAGITVNTYEQISSDSDLTNSPYMAYLAGGNSSSLKVGIWSDTGTFSSFETADTTISHSMPSMVTTSNATASIIHIYTICNGKVYETKTERGRHLPILLD